MQFLLSEVFVLDNTLPMSNLIQLIQLLYNKLY